MLCRKNGIEIKHLSRKQKKEVRSLWGTRDYQTHELYLSVTGDFDARICPEKLFRTKIESKLLDKQMTVAWDDKNFFNRYFSELPFPQTIIHNIRGTFLDNDYQLIDITQVKQLIKENTPLIIKPTYASGCGRNVRLIDDADDIDAILSLYKSEYIIQKVIKQCSEMQEFSQRSVNVMRIITLLIDGKATFLSASLRANTENAISDNDITEDGKGMVVIGIEKDGILKSTGVFSCGLQTDTTVSGKKISECRIPKFDEAVDIVLKAHTKMPMFRIVGWDVTIDENYNPIVVEYNLKGIGVYYYQLVNGPLFGQYTSQIIQELLGDK